MYLTNLSIGVVSIGKNVQLNKLLLNIVNGRNKRESTMPFAAVAFPNHRHSLVFIHKG